MPIFGKFILAFAQAELAPKYPLEVLRRGGCIHIPFECSKLTNARWIFNTWSLIYAMRGHCLWSFLEIHDNLVRLPEFGMSLHWAVMQQSQSNMKTYTKLQVPCLTQLAELELLWDIFAFFLKSRWQGDSMPLRLPFKRKPHVPSN